jgi:hypothetical protein
MGEPDVGETGTNEQLTVETLEVTLKPSGVVLIGSRWELTLTLCDGGCWRLGISRCCEDCRFVAMVCCCLFLAARTIRNGVRSVSRNGGEIFTNNPGCDVISHFAKCDNRRRRASGRLKDVLGTSLPRATFTPLQWPKGQEVKYCPKPLARWAKAD